MGIQARTAKNEARDAETRVCARRSGEEVDESRKHQRDDGIETRLKQNRKVTEQRESEKKRSVRISQSAEMKKQREREVEKRSVRSRQSVQTSRESAENNTSFFWSSFQHEFFYRDVE